MSKENIKITEDNFIWKTLTPLDAERVYASGIFELYVLHDDDTEDLATSIEDVRIAFDRGEKVGIEVGYYGG